MAVDKIAESIYKGDAGHEVKHACGHCHIGRRAKAENMWSAGYYRRKASGYNAGYTRVKTCLYRFILNTKAAQGGNEHKEHGPCVASKQPAE